jgi:hypothetical protein
MAATFFDWSNVFEHLLLELVIQLFPMKVLLAPYYGREKPFFKNASWLPGAFLRK